MSESWPPPPSQPRPRSEILFEFFRGSDQAPMTCELGFNGESYGWEVVFYVRGELLTSRGGFVVRWLAVQWAEEERKAFDKGGAHG